jgi:hypothetical protein
LPGRLLHHPPGSYSQVPSLRTSIIFHLPLVFISPTSPICLSFSSPPLHQFAVLFASLVRSPIFFARSVFVCLLVLRGHHGSREH